jgi:thiol-disulfide isomerase/thioredoxin
VELNAPAPDFLLPGLDGRLHRLSGFRGKIVLVNFWSAECPWSEAADSQIGKYSEAWGESVVHLRVAANANEPESMLRAVSQARDVDILLVDSAASVADLYAAQTTPHLFVVDPAGILRYAGAFDDRTFRQRQPTRFYLRDAVEALLERKLPKVQSAPPYGCTIVRP